MRQYHRFLVFIIFILLSYVIIKWTDIILIPYKTRFRAAIHVPRTSIQTEYIRVVVLWSRLKRNLSSYTILYTRRAHYNKIYTLANCCSAIVETRKCRVCAYFLVLYAQ